MILNILDEDVGFLFYLTPDRIFEAFAGLYETRNRGILAFAPARLTSEEASIASADEDDNRRVNPRKKHGAAFRVDTDSRIAPRLGPRWRAAMTAILLHAVPQNQHTRVCDQIRLVSRQHTAEVTQIMKFADILERCLSRTVYAEREGRSVTEFAQEMSSCSSRCLLTSCRSRRIA